MTGMKRFQFLFFTVFLFLWTNLSLAQINAPSQIPDRVVLNLSENPSTSVAVTWRTSISVSVGFCEWQPVSKRNDWYRKILSVAFVAAIGWGVTGMISYGRVVGFGRSNDFPNAFYGLLMLFVIGGLFGLLGGGLTGLCIESSEKKRVKWARLMAEMVAGSFHLNHHLYVANFIVIFILMDTVENPIVGMNIRKMNFGKYRLLFFSILLFIALLALISISIHDGISGAQERFPVDV